MTISQREDLIGPILSDGTPVHDLIDVERRQASLRLFSDPEVYRYELQYLFARSWIVVAHDTEIPEPGDYVSRAIGTDSVIVARGRDGAISVLLNVCPHRGMQVCRSEAGNAASFRCPYHGWVFGPQGSLLGAPFERDMYGDSLDKENLGLRRARVETYAGIVFANWDETAPPLEDFLGEFSWYLGAMLKRTNDGIECVGAPQRFILRGNWKTAAEQFNGADGYHGVTLHRQMFEARVGGADVEQTEQLLTQQRGMLDAIDVGSRQGHGLRCMNHRVGQIGLRPRPGRLPDHLSENLLKLRDNLPSYLPPELLPDLENNLTEAQLRLLTTYQPGPGGLFPNVGVLHTNIRTFTPLGVDSFELRNWLLVEKKASPEFKEHVRKEMLANNGTSGMVEQDDSESWSSIQRAANGYMGSQQSMQYQAFVGHNPPEDWGGGAYVYKGFSGDDCAWNFWLRYREYMSGNPW